MTYHRREDVRNRMITAIEMKDVTEKMLTG